MWAAVVRQMAAFALTRRGKKLFALIGVLLLCFGAALLVDLQLYYSASFAAVLGAFSAVAYVVQHIKLKRIERERLARKAEAARQRAIAAQARLERIDNAKGALRLVVRESVRATGGIVTETLNDAVVRVSAKAGTFSQSALRAAGGPEGVARIGLALMRNRWRSLRGKARAEPASD